jgi:threonine dehydrogenase-like Zn-dependent dehydrogenase
VRAAVYDGSLLEVREWPDPVPGAGEVLVAPTRVGICGSDVHFVLEQSATTSRLPLVLGHEPAGRVVGVGDRVDRAWLGRRVVVLPIVTCGDCRFCRSGRSVLCSVREVLGTDRDGAWADLIVVPERNVMAIPPAVSDDIAALCTDALGTALHAVRTRGGVGAGARVAIWGAGGLGLAATAIAHALGAASVAVFDPRASARERACVIGADLALHPDDALDELRGQVDIALEFVGGRDSSLDAVRILDRGGRAVIVGISDEYLDAGGLTAFVTREREVVGSMGSEPAEVAELLEMIARGQLTLPGLVGSEVDLENVLEGVHRVADGDAVSGRVMVRVS